MSIQDMLNKMKAAKGRSQKVVQLPVKTKKKPEEPPQEVRRQEPLVEKQPEKGKAAYERDFQERQKEETEEESAVLAETVPRIYFGKTVTAPRHEGCGEAGYILGFGKRPKNAKPAYLREVGKEERSGDSTYNQLTEAMVVLRKHSISLEEGPYADRDGLVDELTKEISKGASGTIQLIDRAIDVLRPFINAEVENAYPRVHESSYSFRFNESFGLLPDEPPAAGSILAHEDRYRLNETTGGQDIMIAHMMEPYILAAAVLRRNNLGAYPALAVFDAGQGEQKFSPLMTIVDLGRQVPLTTFALMRAHPPMGSVDVISDRAMTGVLYAIHAEQRVKHLTLEMVERSKKGEYLTEDEITNQLDRVARCLFDCHRVWPGTHFVSDALVFTSREVGEAAMAMYLGELQANQHLLAQKNPEMAIPGMMEQQASQIAMETGNQYRQFVLNRLSERIEKTEAKSG
ncbi:hypothetical protein GF318_03635 [Candidatus Micrarchaeota archaeon]|nr:hypothetical protein [Candidatus Micrarchaeota archaeon]